MRCCHKWQPLGLRRRAHKSITLAVLGTSCALLPQQFAKAADIWDNSDGNANWSDANNWQDNTEPTSSDAVTFPTPFPFSISTINLSSGETALSLTFNDNYTLINGSLTLGNGAGSSI